MKRKEIFRRRISLVALLVLLLALAGCKPQIKLTMLSPAEIDTGKIKKVAIGNFEVAYVNESYKEERNGVWRTRRLQLSPDQKKSISQQVRAKVVNALGAVPYFSLVYTDEFAQLENDASLQALISSQGYQTKGVDAVINGKIWVDLQKTDGADVAKSSMRFVSGGKKGSFDISVDKLIWWPYKSMRGHMTLEMKMTRLSPTEVIAVTLDSRTFSHRIGQKPMGLMDSLRAGASAVSNSSRPVASSRLEDSPMALPSFEQLIADLSYSIATNFTRKVAVTEKQVQYPIAPGGDDKAKLLIKAGAYEMAIDRLQEVTASTKLADDLYNLGLSFEAIGEYGLASISYKEALRMNMDNFIFSQGVGRIERILRENPQVKRQIAQK